MYDNEDDIEEDPMVQIQGKGHFRTENELLYPQLRLLQGLPQQLICQLAKLQYRSSNEIRFEYYSPLLASKSHGLGYRRTPSSENGTEIHFVGKHLFIGLSFIACQFEQEALSAMTKGTVPLGGVLNDA